LEVGRTWHLRKGRAEVRKLGKELLLEQYDASVVGFMGGGGFIA
jgi:hypothetical protein